MTENNEEIINSAFSFSDMQGIVPKEKQDTSGKYIKTWQITQETETDEAQLGEETEYKGSLATIQEEYETYGTENKQRLTKRTFYKKPNRPNETPEVAYFEVFRYNKADTIIPSENQISYVYKPNILGKNVVDNEDSFDQIIGYRYHKSPDVNIDKSNETPKQINSNEYFTVLNNKSEHKYEIYEKNNHDCYNIIQTILQDKLKNLKDYEISGTTSETIGFLTAMQNNDQNPKCCC